jgi:hypothetical protein
MGVAYEIPTSEVNSINPKTIERSAFIENLSCVTTYGVYYVDFEHAKGSRLSCFQLPLMVIRSPHHLASVSVEHRIGCLRKIQADYQMAVWSGAGVSNGGPGGIRTRDLPEIRIELANRTFFGPSYRYTRLNYRPTFTRPTTSNL